MLRWAPPSAWIPTRRTASRASSGLGVGVGVGVGCGLVAAGGGRCCHAAGMAAGVGSGESQQRQRRRDAVKMTAAEYRAKHRPILHAINESTKWTVSLAAFGYLCYCRFSPAACWCLVGSVANAFASKVLKALINQSRPPNARKADPGMPSSHAQSLFYFGSYISLAALSRFRTPQAVSTSVAAMAMSTFMTWLRVELGYHTFDQVAAGAFFGSLAAFALYSLGHSFALPAIASGRTDVMYALYGATAFACGAFTVKETWKWRHDVQKVYSKLVKA
eukprot:jgi/Chlat1/541/Chrsp103S01121